MNLFDPNREFARLDRLVKLHASWSDEDIRMTKYYLNSHELMFLQYGYRIDPSYSSSIRWRIIGRVFARKLTSRMLARMLRVAATFFFLSFLPRWSTLGPLFFIAAYELVLKEDRKVLNWSIAFRRMLRALSLAVTMWILFIITFEFLRVVFPWLPSTFEINDYLHETFEFFSSLLHQ